MFLKYPKVCRAKNFSPIVMIFISYPAFFYVNCKRPWGKKIIKEMWITNKVLVKKSAERKIFF
jgi:hypothetical protein